jgi:microcystin-dependent protein
MSDQFLAEIRMFGSNFAPSGWALCDGQLLSISQNTALFSLLGTTFGGDGRSTFGLPNLQGCAPLHWGQGAGLSDRVIGESAGSDNVTLLQSEMPSHNHNPNCVTATAGNSNSPGIWSKTLGAGRQQAPPNYATAAPVVAMNPAAIGFAGGSQPHNNMSPYLVVTFIIALQGIFPSRG